MADVRENRDLNRFEIWVDDALAGFTEHRGLGPVVSFVHTEIAPEYGGQGLATQLIRSALDTERERGSKILPVCPFVKAFVEKHPEYLDLVPENRRATFGLPA
ncbi:GNAT family N-acetyltransferase [Kineosporia succinea]|uniref:GNAT family acetyltransferase n=1 Tax=Kineosporia succinea TaxID=84632 RepID=A0ABT9P3S5_9ACTN|nr:GNAT family N-acetyltransferase [Kineosporia succinea]MDP9827132.1 putative GNAT family acetyltransferase [Kineosporia succinea]